MSGRWLVGLLLILAGIGWLLTLQGVQIAGHPPVDFWPVLIIVLGLYWITRRPYGSLFGLLTMIIGGVLLLQQLDLLPGYSWNIIWPLLIILFGLWMLFPRRRRTHMSPQMATTNTDAQAPRVEASFGGIETRDDSQNFRGGRVSASFGAAVLDLRNARLAPEGADLDAHATFGGVEIRVPEDWIVVISGVPFLGGWNNTTARAGQAPNGSPVLRVRAYATFGGIDIKN